MIREKIYNCVGLVCWRDSDNGKLMVCLPEWTEKLLEKFIRFLQSRYMLHKDGTYRGRELVFFCPMNNGSDDIMLEDKFTTYRGWFACDEMKSKLTNRTSYFIKGEKVNKKKYMERYSK